MDYNGNVVYQEDNILKILEGRNEKYIPYDGDFHSHGLWTDCKSGFLNLEKSPRHLPYFARIMIGKQLDLSGLVEIQAENFKEKRFEALLSNIEKNKNNNYALEVDDNSSTIFFDFPNGKKSAIHRVQEVLTNVPKVHYLALDLSRNVYIQGGRSPSDTVKEIKDVNGKVCKDHPYFATLKGKSDTELNRGNIDALEFNGQINTGNLNSFLTFGSLGLTSGLIASMPFGAEIPFALGAGLISGLGGLTLSAYMNHCNNLVLKRAPELDLPILGSSDGNTPDSVGITRTRFYLTKKEIEDKPNLIKHLFNSLSEGRYQVVSEKDSITRMFGHIAKGTYSQIRGHFGWFYDNEFYSEEEKKMGLPNA